MASEPTLPPVLLRGLDRGESAVGRILLWVLAVFFAVLALIFVLAPDPWEDKVATLPWWLGCFGVMFAYAWWLSRKHQRVHRSALARIIVDQPQRITRVREELRRPNPVGTGIERVTVPFDGRTERRPRTAETARVLGVPFDTRSWICLTIEGKWIERKLVVRSRDAPELLSFLFDRLAVAHPACRWGDEESVGDLRSSSAERAIPARA